MDDRVDDAPACGDGKAGVKLVTVIPINELLDFGSGPFKKDVGIFNNSPSPIDVIVDVVGYFIGTRRRRLDRQRILDTDSLAVI